MIWSNFSYLLSSAIEEQERKRSLIHDCTVYSTSMSNMSCCEVSPLVGKSFCSSSSVYENSISIKTDQVCALHPYPSDALFLLSIGINSVMARPIKKNQY